MRRLIVCLALLLTLLLALPVVTAAQVNGYLQTIDGKPILTVWGTHSERGYAAGWLSGDDGKAVFDDYVIEYLCDGSPFAYAYLRYYYVSNYSVDSKYEDEADGIIQGMLDAGISLYNSTLGRSIDATDILICNSVVDLNSLTMAGPYGCSSMSSWGAATMADPTLNGHLVITRLLDWGKHPTLTDNPLLVVHFPSEPDEQPWLSIGYAGLFGALSAISESGVSAFLNMGNYEVGSTGAPYHPMLLTVRNGLEVADYDGDGVHTPDDVTAAIDDRTRSSDTIVHVTHDNGPSSHPIIIESNNAAGVAVRDQGDNTLIPGDHLVATNHFRALYSPVSCYRYTGISDSLLANVYMTSERSWDVMEDAAGVYSSNIQCMQYVESTGDLLWSVDTYTEPAYTQPPTKLNVWDLFGCPLGVDDITALPDLRQNFPNPFNPTTTISFGLTAPSRCTLTVYGVSGRRVATLVDGTIGPGTHRVTWDGTTDAGTAVATGVYVYRLETELGTSERKMLLVK